MEDIGHPVKLELNLQRLSMIAVVSRIFEQPDIKAKLKETIPTCEIMQEPSLFKPLKNALKELAHEKLDRLNLPKTMLAEAQDMAVVFTKKIISWAHNVRHIPLDLSYLDIVY